MARFRKDLYRGTAEYYDRFRPPYPAVLLDDLRARVPLDGTGRLLDLACGTGQVACALAPDFAEVWAVDQEPDAVEFGRRKAVDNIRWIAASAEEVPLDGRFDLVTIGNAFHRLDRDAVARRLVAHTGCVALLWSGTPWGGDLPWQQALTATIADWKGEGWQQPDDEDSHEQVLRRAGLTYEGLFEFSVVHRWSVESLVGFLYSTSFASRAVLGDQADAFERDLRARLLACSPDGVFEQELTFAYELTRC